MRSATAFAYACIGAPRYQAPKPAESAVCWLCGGPTDGRGWPRKTAIPPTFTNVNLAAAPASDALCVPCAYFGSSETWKAYCAAHPERGLKSMHPLSWRSYSHVFSAAGHECPTRARWRELLIHPPEPPFLFVIAESGQKHLLFRAQVAYDWGCCPVQIEEDSVWVDRAEFAATLVTFEALYRLRFSKEQIASGRYNQAQLLKVGLAAWREVEPDMAVWRRLAPDLVRLAAFCAQRPEGEEDSERFISLTATI